MTFLVALLLGLFLGIGSGSGHVKMAIAGVAVDVTQADSGRQLAVGADEEVDLRLSHRWKWSKPQVTGPAGLQRVDFVTDPGFDEWIVQPTGKGTVTIRAAGRPGPRHLKLTLRVR